MIFNNCDDVIVRILLFIICFTSNAFIPHCFWRIWSWWQFKNDEIPSEKRGGCVFLSLKLLFNINSYQFIVL